MSHAESHAATRPSDVPEPHYALALQLRLVDLGLAEVVVVDGVPVVAVDPIFEAARAAAFAGLHDWDCALADKAAALVRVD